MSAAIFWRIIYAVIIVVLLLIAIPLLCEVVGFPLPGAAWSLIRICIAAIALLYVLRGSPIPPPPA